MQLADVFVVTATILAWLTLVPQIRRLSRTGDTSGISTTWPAIGLVSNAAWTAYLASQSLWAAMPSTAGMVIFYAIILRHLHRLHQPMLPPLIRGTIWTVILAVVGVASGWHVLGLVLGWSYAVQMAPPVWSAYRTADPSGVSQGTWILLTVEAALWLVYGWLLADLPIIIFALTGLAAGCLVLVRVWVTRSSAQPVMVSSDRF